VRGKTWSDDAELTNVTEKHISKSSLSKAKLRRREGRPSGGLGGGSGRGEERWESGVRSQEAKRDPAAEANDKQGAENP